MKVFISGDGIAGLTLAFWLHHHGHQPLVVERSPKVRDEGRLRPTVENVQEAGRRFARWFVPESRARLMVRDAVMRMATNSLISLVLKRPFWIGPAR